MTCMLHNPAAGQQLTFRKLSKEATASLLKRLSEWHSRASCFLVAQIASLRSVLGLLGLPDDYSLARK